jgi:hypothetical protein
MHGVMAPPERYRSRPLMLAAATPHRPPRGLMSTEATDFAGFDLKLELKRLLWVAVAVLAVVLYLWHLAARF